MSIQRSSVVSIHPYFKVHEGKMPEFRKLLDEFVSRTSKEEACFYYDFTIMDDQVVFCREAYAGADGLLAHIENVGEVIARASELSDLIRVEIHGGAGELKKLKEPLKELQPDYYVFETGLGSD
ncbi:MAG: putative quinol monooxygenase [Haloferula sp.]